MHGTSNSYMVLWSFRHCLVAVTVSSSMHWSECVPQRAVDGHSRLCAYFVMFCFLLICLVNNCAWQ
jgi:hypothetical protein